MILWSEAVRQCGRVKMDKCEGEKKEQTRFTHFLIKQRWETFIDSFLFCRNVAAHLFAKSYQWPLKPSFSRTINHEMYLWYSSSTARTVWYEWRGSVWSEHLVSSNQYEAALKQEALCDNRQHAVFIFTLQCVDGLSSWAIVHPWGESKIK